jgi:hypothetical protein
MHQFHLPETETIIVIIIIIIINGDEFRRRMKGWEFLLLNLTPKRRLLACLILV